MFRTYLLVHPVAYQCIAATIDYIFGQLTKYCCTEVELLSCKSIDAVATEERSLVFIIGDSFQHFSRRHTCTYVFINFSLLYCLGDDKAYSRPARRWIYTKHRRFIRKAPLYDYVIDFHSDEAAARLNSEFRVSARHFALGLRDDAYVKHENRERIYDVGFVGSPTPRRVVLAKRLARMGLRVSPLTGMPFEHVAARSKVVLNVHAYRSANIEWPRIVSASLSGAVLVNETSADFTHRIPGNLYISTHYCYVASATKELVESPARCEQLAAAARRWMHERYLPACDESWRHLVEDLRRHFGFES